MQYNFYMTTTTTFLSDGIPSERNNDKTVKIM